MNDPSLAQWHLERARKVDVRAALSCIERRCSHAPNDLAALGLAWLYRHGMVWQVRGAKGKGTAWELTEAGKALAAAVR